MDETGEMAQGQETEEILALLENSQKWIRLIFLGLALQYRAIESQRRQLFEPGSALCQPGPQALRVAGSLVTLAALFGFQGQAEDLAQKAAQAGDCVDLTDIKLGANTILISLIRLARLLGQPSSQAPSSGPVVLEGLAEDLETDV